jgi:phage terminase large subunit GpA-like protein
LIKFEELLDPQVLANEVKASVLPPPPTLTISEWADRERVLGPEETSMPGRWKTEIIPYLKDIMDAVSDPEVRTVVVKGSARIGKTEFELNVIGFHIDQDPSPMLLVYPSDQKVMEFSKEKLSPMLENTPALRGKVAAAKSRDSKNTLDHKVFQGGFIAMAGSNTPNGLDSRTVRLVLFDELDKCAKAAKQFGDPRALAKNRTITYPGRWKHILVSTPSEEGQSPITEEYEKTDMCRLYLPCAHCGVFEVIKMVQIKWPAGRPEEAVYVCEHCGCVITDAEKLEMLQRYEWRAEKGPHRGAVGFALWAGYSPWVTWVQIAETHTSLLNEGPEAYKTFVNEWLGETWNPNQGREGKVEGLLQRARESRYASGTVPNEVGILFGGSDTQGDRLEFLVRGVGVGKKQWTVQHVVIDGNLSQAEPWDRLEELILATWPREDGKGMRIRKFCVDVGGNHLSEAMAFCKRATLRGIVVPIRGSARPMVGMAIPAKKRSRLHFLNTIALKDTIYASLRIENPAIPGYQSFPNDLEAGYFQQLLAEKKIDGKYVEVTKNARNEIIDLHTYTDGAMALYKLRPGELEALVAKAQTFGDAPAQRREAKERTDPEGEEEPEESAPQAQKAPAAEPTIRVIQARAQQDPFLGGGRFRGGGPSGAW